MSERFSYANINLPVFSTNKSTNFSANLTQNILGKMKKASKVRQKRKNLITALAYFLSTEGTSLHLQRRLETRLCPNLFPEILSLTLFDNLESDLCIMSVILYFQSHFASQIPKY